jgi:hypothetical protein
VCVCSADIVSDEHFGGGMLSMKPAVDEEKREKTWKERMEEVIAKSKKAKVRNSNYSVIVNIILILVSVDFYNIYTAYMLCAVRATDGAGTDSKSHGKVGRPMEGTEDLPRSIAASR